MPVIDTKVAASWPFFRIDICPTFRRQKICYYGNSIFIIISDKTLISICGIATNDTCPFVGGLCWIIVWDDYLMSWLNIHDFFTFRLDIAFTPTAGPQLLFLVAWRPLRGVSILEIEILF